MKVIYFDGVCGLCNGFIDFIMKIDKKKIFYFSPLQSEFASRNLPYEFTTDLKTVVYQNDKKLLKKAEAVLSIISEIGGIWKIAAVARLLPASVLNFFYDFIATNRYKFFGKKETCRLPTPEERSRFVS